MDPEWHDEDDYCEIGYGREGEEGMLASRLAATLQAGQASQLHDGC